MCAQIIIAAVFIKQCYNLKKDIIYVPFLYSNITTDMSQWFFLIPWKLFCWKERGGAQYSCDLTVQVGLCSMPLATLDFRPGDKKVTKCRDWKRLTCSSWMQSWRVFLCAWRNCHQHPVGFWPVVTFCRTRELLFTLAGWQARGLELYARADGARDLGHRTACSRHQEVSEMSEMTRA